ncbi:MAG TPA: DUF5657 family protein [Patescibacteria group bacterium]|nr:DUF5657 family protein [Patescibacteria group bacterium]
MIFSFSIWPIIKIFILFFLGIYIIFAFVVVRQVQLMTSTLEVGFEGQLKFLSFLHFLFAIAVFAFAIIIL